MPAHGCWSPLLNEGLAIHGAPAAQAEKGKATSRLQIETEPEGPLEGLSSSSDSPKLDSKTHGRTDTKASSLESTLPSNLANPKFSIATH